MITAYFLIVIIAVSLMVLPSLPYSEWAIFTVLFSVFVFGMRYLTKMKNLLISTSIAFIFAIATVYSLNKFTSIEIPYFFIFYVGIVNIIFAAIIRKNE
ncbi:hypothetical protein N5C46_11195 [Rossellomorea vietnamensis]|uniref:Uncharacterized protein n=1 Tax=Rossellomorea vietnamensis TaxID=218284 RepID=A0ACD4CD07_9BACI|nr:hypothetical protein [Rossellomorea vietnamensis]UXH46574.1 hypothetical protein N5C46_11195 [Rossellomorea vietnamensis]